MAEDGAGGLFPAGRESRVSRRHRLRVRSEECSGRRTVQKQDDHVLVSKDCTDLHHVILFSRHYYFPLFLYDTKEYVWWQKDLAHRVFGPAVFSGAGQEVTRLGGGQFLTEFGICVPSSARPDYWGTKECLWVMEMADSKALSWCYWDTSDLGVLWDKEGNQLQEAVDILSRPYPMAVAGKELTYEYDSNTKTFHLEFYPDQSISAPSLLFIPDHIYEGRLHLVASADLSVQVSEDDRRVLEVRLESQTDSSEKSWVTVGVSEEIQSRNDSWLDYFLTYLPILRKK